MHSQSDPSGGCPGCVKALTRRRALQLASNGFGYLAFSAMAAGNTPVASVERSKPHFTPKAKNVIFLFMPGRRLPHGELRSQTQAGRSRRKTRQA